MDRIRDQIDRALLKDDEYRRKRDMQFLLLPTRFPSPESMGQGDITVWTNWICEESEVMMNQLEEELADRGDPDDPFNGSANGVYQPLYENLSLPPPVLTPRRENGSDYREDSQNSRENEQKTDMRLTNRSQTVEKPPQMQVEPREYREHLWESLNLTRSNRTLHSQLPQNQNRRTQSDEAFGDNHNRTQEHNLIMFMTPSTREHRETKGAKEAKVS